MTLWVATKCNGGCDYTAASVLLPFVACAVRRTVDVEAACTLTSRVRSLAAPPRTRFAAVSFPCFRSGTTPPLGCNCGGVLLYLGSMLGRLSCAWCMLTMPLSNSGRHMQ